MTSWNCWSSYLPPHISVSMARFTGRNSAQTWAALFNDNDNDNDKRLGLTAKADQPDHKNTIHQK